VPMGMGMVMVMVMGVVVVVMMGVERGGNHAGNVIL
jgi:hypothetical protein